MKRVLYVDDEVMNTILFQANFEKVFEVTTFNSPLKALEYVRFNGDEIDIIVSDMKMPDMTGVEFIKSVRTDYPHMSCYILTGFGHESNLDEAVRNGEVVKIFQKPFDRNQLIAEFS